MKQRRGYILQATLTFFMHKNKISVQIISRYVDITYVRCHKKTVPLCRGDRCTNHDVPIGTTEITFDEIHEI